MWVALATGIAVVEICTALFDFFWRGFIDLHTKIFGSSMSSVGVWLLIPLALYVLMVMVAVIFGMCAAKCVCWWQWLLTFLFALPVTLCCLCSDKFIYLHPARLLGEGKNSSARWYLGAAIQLAIGFGLLWYFRKSKAVPGRKS